MFDRLKRVLVESFVGAIGLGYLLAQIALYFMSMFTAPVSGWAEKRLVRGIVGGTTANLGFPLEASLTPGLAFLLLSLIWYVLLRWLYFTPPKERTPEAGSEEAA